MLDLFTTDFSYDERPRKTSNKHREFLSKAVEEQNSKVLWLPNVLFRRPSRQIFLFSLREKKSCLFSSEVAFYP